MPEQELSYAKRYLVDSFPLLIETPARIADLVSDLRVFDLPDDYWDSYRSRISGVTAEQALQAAAKYIRPERALIVVVGKAAGIARSIAKYGPVTVVDAEGRLLLSPQPGAAAEAVGDIKSKKSD